MSIQYPTKAPRGCFVYLFRVDGVPRYIGKGRGKRHMGHEKAARGKSRTPWHNFLRRAIADARAIAVEIIADNLTDAEAFDHENFAVEQYGRVFDKTGSLLNWHAGGKGGDSASCRAAASRPEVRAKLSAASRAAASRPEVKAKHAATAARPEVKAKRSAAARAAWARPEMKAKRSAASRAAASRPEVKAKISAASRAAWARPEVKAKRSAAARSTMARPEVRAKISAAMRAAATRPEVKANKSAASRAAKARPEVKAKISAASRAAWARRKAARAVPAQLPLPI